MFALKNTCTLDSQTADSNSNALRQFDIFSTRELSHRNSPGGSASREVRTVRNVKFIGRLVAGVAVASVLLAGGVVHSPSAQAAPPAAPWTSQPVVGSWVPV